MLNSWPILPLVVGLGIVVLVALGTTFFRNKDERKKDRLYRKQEGYADRARRKKLVEKTFLITYFLGKEEKHPMRTYDDKSIKIEISTHGHSYRDVHECKIWVDEKEVFWGRPTDGWLYAHATHCYHPGKWESHVDQLSKKANKLQKKASIRNTNSQLNRFG